MRRWIGLILGGIWLVAAVVLLVVAVAAVHGDRATVETASIVGTAGAVDRSGIDAFVTFAQESEEPSRDGLPSAGLRGDHTAEGLRRLAAALTTLGADAPVTTTVRAAADQITDNPFSLGHASLVHEAFSVAARELGRMVPDEAVRLRQLANNIRPDRPLIDQARQVQRFFEAASDAVRIASPQSYRGARATMAATMAMNTTAMISSTREAALACSVGVRGVSLTTE